jgi:hypothetical protein
MHAASPAPSQRRVITPGEGGSHVRVAAASGVVVIVLVLPVSFPGIFLSRFLEAAGLLPVMPASSAGLSTGGWPHKGV